jgi:Family of unknown function (DUF6200)
VATSNAAETAVRADAKAPVIIDLGKHRRKRIKGLRKGTGRLVDEVSSCLDELKASGAIGANAQPVIIVVREKRRRISSLIPGL